MDIEKLIEQLNDWNEKYISNLCGDRTIKCEEYCIKDDCLIVKAATALSTLQAENAQLRADLEYEREHADAYYEECGQWEAENEKLRAELEQVKAERDMAVEDFQRIGSEGLCSVCGNLNAPDLYCADCKGTAHIVTDMFEWRGQKED